MIKKLSHNIACYLSCELDYEDDKIEILSYGLQILLGTSFKVTSIMLVAYLLGIFRTTSIALISFVTFRRIIGGTHYDTYSKCFLASTVSIIILGMMGSVIEIKEMLILVLTLLVYIQGLLSIIVWVPAGTEKKRIKNEALRKKIKRKAVALITVWAASVICIKDFISGKYIFSSILGVLLAFLFTTPFAYKFTKLKFIKKI